MIAKKLTTIIFIIFSIGTLLTACQQTPDKNIIIAKNNAEEIIIDSADNNQESLDEFFYEYPDHVDMKFTVVDGKFDISIDRDVIIPDIDNIPVAKITEDPFTQERANDIRKYFMTGGELLTLHVKTKEDIDQEIVEVKRGYLVDGEYVVDEYADILIKDLLEERENAPDKCIDKLISDYSIINTDMLTGRVVVDGVEEGLLSLSKQVIGFNADAIWIPSDEYSEYGIDMTEEQAICRINEVLSELSINDMCIVSAKQLDFKSETEPNGKTIFGGYQFFLMRSFGGMEPVIIQSWSITKTDSYDVTPSFDSEYINIVIDEYGDIKLFVWGNPIKVVETVTDHVNILPFEDILSRFEAFTKIQYSYKAEYTNSDPEILQINEISLKLFYLPIENNNAECLYVPCWHFSYNDSPEEYIIVSAVDGKVVSPYSTVKYERMMRVDK